jgi:thiol-disulfide isomerase/thioredoxin
VRRKSLAKRLIRLDDGIAGGYFVNPRPGREMFFTIRRKSWLLAFAFVAMGCAPQRPATHGTLTTLSAASTENYERCVHKVPKEVCTRCNPELETKFKNAKDWCPEHGVPESQCFECHPDLTFDPLPELPKGADVLEISHQGEDVPSLEFHAAKGKITLFDFYAVWCAPCRKIDAHVFGLLQKRDDLALRKLNVVSWETPMAARYLKNVEGLPYVVVFGKSGERLRSVSGFDLGELDKAIAEAGSR